MQWLLVSVFTVFTLNCVVSSEPTAEEKPAQVRNVRSFGETSNAFGQPLSEDMEDWRALYAKRLAMIKRGFGFDSGSFGAGTLGAGNMQDWSGFFQRDSRRFGSDGGRLGGNAGLGDDGLQNWMAFYQRRNSKRSV